MLGYSDASPDPRIELEKLELTTKFVAYEFYVAEPRVLQRRKNLGCFFEQIRRSLRDALNRPSPLWRIGKDLSMRANSKRASVLEQPAHRIRGSPHEFLKCRAPSIARFTGAHLSISCTHVGETSNDSDVPATFTLLALDHEWYSYLARENVQLIFARGDYRRWN